MQHKFMAFATVASLGLFLSACSDEDEVLTQNATSSGVVSGFGSVYVNGLRYVTENSNILSNGVESDEAALKVGMKVVVNAHQSSATEGTAFEVKYLADAIGEIEAIDLAAPSISVLGQTYLITSATKLDEVIFNELRESMVVELSAFENANGSFTVTYLTIKDDFSEHQLTGRVSKLKARDKIFFIGELLVNYGDADVDGSLYDGSTVSLKNDIGLIASEFNADEVSVQGMLLVIGGTLTVSGIVETKKEVDEGTVIKVDGRNFLLTNEADFSQGDVENLRVGDQVNLIATIIESEQQYPYYPINNIRVELANEISLEGIVQSATGSSFTLFGQEFTVDSYTLYEDNSEQELRYFTFSDIAIGDRLDIDAYELNDILISRKVERKETGTSEQDTYEIEGVVDSIDVDLPSFSVKGINVLVDADTKFENALGNSINQEVFFQTIVKGDEVEVETYYTVDGLLVALEVEIDGDDKDNEVELVGTIDNFTNIFSFTVNGHQVMTNLQTEYDNGNASDLKKGALIEVEGQMNGNKLIADEIDFIETEVNQ
ncbi:MAG: hypothetical protein HRT55_07150 [Colwellia sp.]|uniref:DUF5666 domain-containing protein n=1 Tax=Colwellia sp. TaxID=56799 RepID=UPI0025BAB0DA|nr:DUF5666 domain-containing protein [Colwellia sp.]NQZ26078.1 hypothetical protein [Colwellia sp.]